MKDFTVIMNNGQYFVVKAWHVNGAKVSAMRQRIDPQLTVTSVVEGIVQQQQYDTDDIPWN